MFVGIGLQAFGLTGPTFGSVFIMGGLVLCITSCRDWLFRQDIQSLGLSVIHAPGGAPLGIPHQSALLIEVDTKTLDSQPFRLRNASTLPIHNIEVTGRPFADGRYCIKFDRPMNSVSPGLSDKPLEFNLTWFNKDLGMFADMGRTAKQLGHAAPTDLQVARRYRDRNSSNGN